MLKSLYISSFVLIDELNLQLDNGMSVLTGETGAGKSIIIDALGQLCGQRASVSLIKKGCSKAYIEGIFDTVTTPKFLNVLNDLHIEESDEYVISKEILSSGKSVIKINNRISSSTALKQLMPFFIDIHSQFETQKLFEEKNHLHMLDQYGNETIEPLLIKYQKQYEQYLSLNNQLKEAVNEDLSDEQLEYLESQLNEIDEYEYSDEDIENLESELNFLKNHEKLNDIMQSYQASMNQAIPLLKDALSYLEVATNYGEFDEDYKIITDCYYNIVDKDEHIVDDYRLYDFDESRFNEVQDILYHINRLKRKYGFTMERIKEYREELVKNIEHIHHRDEYISSLEKKLADVKKQCVSIADEIHNERIKYALKFEKEIMLQFKNLYLENAIFKVNIDKSELNRYGFDRLVFMVAMNQGQSLSLLTESASGGEISRIMLAIKILILSYQSVETIVFDEVDTGISGKVARGVGMKMVELAHDKQVICITHLPQVASLAQYHYHIEKNENLLDTTTSITLLNQEQRILEIACMLSGNNVTDEAILNAKSLLNN